MRVPVAWRRRLNSGVVLMRSRVLIVGSCCECLTIERGRPSLGACHAARSFPGRTLLYEIKSISKTLKINEILVEAAGVELFSVLTTRKLLILGTATTAKKAPLPDPLYVYCTKMFFALESRPSDSEHSIP